MKKFYLSLLALVFLFAGCASTPVVDRGVIAPDGTTEEELCTVKVHYVLYVSDIDGQRVNFDNVNPDRLNGMVFQSVKLPAGKHSFIVRMNSSATTGPMRLSSELEAGKNYFLDVHINGLKGTVQIVMVDEETGKEL